MLTLAFDTSSAQDHYRLCVQELPEKQFSPEFALKRARPLQRRRRGHQQPVWTPSAVGRCTGGLGRARGCGSRGCGGRRQWGSGGGSGGGGSGAVVAHISPREATGLGPPTQRRERRWQ